MRKLLILFFLLAAGYITMGQTLHEDTFKSLGYQDFYIRDSNFFACSNYTFPVPNDTNADALAVLSLKVAYLPSQGGTPILDVYLGDDKAPLAEFLPQDLTNGFARIVLPRDRLGGGKNLVRVCGKASPGNTIWISSGSAYGLYKIPYFPKGRGLVAGLETYKPMVGVPFEIVAIAKNYGGEDAQVSLSYRRLDLKQSLPEASVLDGETSKTGVVKKCTQWGENSKCLQPGELKITYKAVANKPVPMTLLPAVMVYSDVFGEETVISNRPDIGALDSNRVIAQVLLENDKSFAGQKIPIKILVKNTGIPASNISVKIRTGLEVGGDEEKTIASLSEGQTEEVTFTAMAAQPGNYELGCSFSYEGRQFECQSTNILLEPQAFTPELIGAALLTIAGLAVFGYFYYYKKDEQG